MPKFNEWEHSPTMGHIVKTDAGNFRANWRDATGKQKAKTFKTKKEASAFLAETESSLNKGTYVDPHAGKQRFGKYAAQWMDARHSQNTTAARDRSIMKIHVLPRWGDVPLGKIDHLAVQRWVTELNALLSPATIAKCHQLMSGVFKAALRDRVVGFNPCDAVQLPSIRRKDTDDQVITPDQVTDDLIPVTPNRYRALVGLAAGTGLRWGECIGLRWSAVDWDGWNRACEPHDVVYCRRCLPKRDIAVQVVRVAVEVAGTVTTKPFPKSRAGRRTVPVAPFAAQLLAEHRDRFPQGPAGEVFTNEAQGPFRRTLFRSRIWRPALVRAGILGKVGETSPSQWQAMWTDREGHEHLTVLPTEREAVRHVAKHQAGGLRFHDLRHSYATWLVSNGVPVNEVARVMGHSKASVTLNRYTHVIGNRKDDKIRDALADFLLTPDDEEDPE